MRFHSAASDHESTRDAGDRLIEQAKDALADRVDLALVFFTAEHRDEADELIERLWLELDPQAVVGCSAEGVIGGDREIERSPGIALFTADLPNLRIHPFHIPHDEWQDLLSDESALHERLGHGPATRALIGFGDPFTTPLQQFLAALDRSFPASPLIGGMASSARTQGGNALVRNDEIYTEGFVGVSLSGPLDVQTVVSQGCRPIGSNFVVTKGRENIVETLGGRPALVVLRELVNQIPAQDQALLQNGLFLGQAISEYRDRFARGDFLVRNIIGANDETGAVAVGAFVKVGQTVQFHVRDAATADEDLRLLLEAQSALEPPAGGLLFSCNGRGTRMFDQPGHDIAAAHQALPNTPVAGFFAAGEIGPIGGKNFVHGQTASLALFRPAPPDSANSTINP